MRSWALIVTLASLAGLLGAVIVWMAKVDGGADAHARPPSAPHIQRAQTSHVL